MSDSNLPSGWAEVTLGTALISVVGGGTPSRKVPAYFGGQIPWFTVKDMKSLKPNDAEEHITEAAIADSATNLIPANTLIVATRIALGKAIRPTVACAINQDLKALVLGSGINSDFLLYWVGANQRVIQDLGSGTTVSGIRLEALHGLPLLLPPPAEQTRIVAKIEELLSDLDAGVAELKAAQKKLTQYRQSLLKAAVEGALTSEWRKQRQFLPHPNPSPARGEGLEPNTAATLAPLPPRGGGAGGEGENTPATQDEPWLQARARELRQQQTPDEQALWQQLRAKRFSGHKFRRQQVLGRFIVDFVCFAKRLVVELDGGQHAEAVDYDNQRDAWLEQQGFRVLRFWNNEWSQQPEAVLEAIWQALQQQPPLPNPSPARGEGLEGETGEQLLQRILSERRARWEAKQLAKFAQQGKPPPKDWQKKYPEPVQPDTTDLPKLPEGWVWATIDQLAQVGTGVTPLRSKSAYFNEGTIPWVTSGALNSETVKSATELVTELATKECRLELYPVGSLLVAMYGEGKTRGKCSELLIPATINQAIAAIVLAPAAQSSKSYLKAFLLDSYERMRAEASGGVQPNLNLQIIKSIALPLPPHAEQSEITKLLDGQFDLISQQQAAVEFGLKQSNAQRQNILRAAFAGQLVPQDPNDEPASVLLERIRAERAGRDAVKKPRGQPRKETAP